MATCAVQCSQQTTQRRRAQHNDNRIDKFEVESWLRSMLGLQLPQVEPLPITDRWLAVLRWCVTPRMETFAMALFA